MKSILVATDFSVRSDRAIRRAILLAREHGASLVLLHAVDDDQPARIVKAEREAASALLDEQARTIRDVDGLACEARLALGDPFDAIAAAAADRDLVVIGPHRRQALKDVFVGTTAERAIRSSRRPVLMANAVPSGAWRHVLLAVDLSESSADAARAVTELGLCAHAALTVLHVFDAPATPVMAHAAASAGDFAAWHQEAADAARAALDGFLAPLAVSPVSRIVEPNTSSAAEVIGGVAASVRADLLVLGTRGRSGVAKILLGSVCEAVLRVADVDVLAVPPRRGS